MRISNEQVRKVAKLANLPLSNEEEEDYSNQLSKILDYIDQLNSVNTTKIEPTFNVSLNTNVTREDVSGISLAQDEVLNNAPQKKDGFFVTKGVFDGE